MSLEITYPDPHAKAGYAGLGYSSSCHFPVRSTAQFNLKLRFKVSQLALFGLGPYLPLVKPESLIDATKEQVTEAKKGKSLFFSLRN